MKNPILIYSESCKVSRDFKAYLDSIDFKYCLLPWVSDNQHPKQVEESWRYVYMCVSGALDPEPKCGPPEQVYYSDKDIESGSYPNEHDRWIMQCECHKGEGYIGPNISIIPSLVYDLDDGTLGLWECHPERNEGKDFTIKDLIPEKMRDSVTPGFHLAGQTIESAIVCAQSQYYGNNIMMEAIRRHIKRFNTINLSEPELVTIKSKQSVELKNLV